MNFLYPQFLFALFAVLIPVIIHLFNFQRYKKVYFSNVAFLKEVKHSTKAKSNLKHLLILLTRILAIVFIVFAFAQPFIPVKNQNTKSKTIGSSIFIDNSFSSQNRNTDGIISDISREFAYQLVDQLPNHINHQLLTNTFQGAQQHLYPTTEIIKQINEIETSPKSQTLSDIIKRQKSAFDNQPFNSYIISDFQKSQFNFASIIKDTSRTYTLIPIEPVLSENISIDSVWFTNPVHRINQGEEVHFRIRNHSNSEAQNVRVTLELNNQPLTFANVTVPANAYLDTSLVFHTKTTGWHAGVIQIEDFPIVFDNSFYFSFNVKKKINVLVISSNNSTTNIKKAFLTEPYFVYSESNESTIDFAKLSATDLLLLNEIEQFSSGMLSSISEYVKNGGSLVIIPSPNEKQASLNELLTDLNVSTLGKLTTDSSRVNYINLESNIYKDVFTQKNAKVNLPTIYKNFRLKKSNSISERTLLRTASQQNILNKWEVEKGQVYLFTIPFQQEFSNFKLHSIFLPTLFQIAFYSSPQQEDYLMIDKDEFVNLKYNNASNQTLYHISNQELKMDIIPEIYPINNGVRLGFHGQIKTSGTYLMTVSDSIMAYLSFNYLRIESNPEFYTESELQALISEFDLTNFSILSGNISDFSTEFDKRKSGIELWRWFVIGALLFLAFEIILIRYFKPSVL